MSDLTPEQTDMAADGTSDYPDDASHDAAVIQEHVAHIARGCRSDGPHSSVACEATIDNALDSLLARVHALELASSSLLATWNNWNSDLPADHPLAVGIVRLRAVVLEGAAGNEQADAG